MNINKSEQIAYFKPFHGHIHNPGMGIICMAMSDHMVTGYSLEERQLQDRKPPFTLTRNMLERVTALSYIDSLYLRVGWNDMQKERGKLTLPLEWEMAIEQARESGKSWGFRIMQCSPSSPREHLIPEFLENKLPLYPYYDGDYYGKLPRKLPLYTDEYLKYWTELLQLLGDRYDADPALEYVDFSGYGLWGEGHHGCHAAPDGLVIDLELDTPERTEEVIGRLLDAHTGTFRKTPMVVNLVLSRYQAAQEAIRKGAWVRRDSYANWFEAGEAAWGLNKSPEAAMIFETVMPGLNMEDCEDPAFRCSSLDMPNRMCDYGAAYGIIGFNPMDTLYADHMVPQLFDAFKTRVGYRLRPSIVWKAKEGDHLELILGMVNDGVANPPGKVVFEASCKGKTSQTEVSGGVFSGRMHLVRLPLAEGIEDSDVVILSAFLQIGEKRRPVRFAADINGPEAPFSLQLQLSHTKK